MHDSSMLIVIGSLRSGIAGSDLRMPLISREMWWLEKTRQSDPNMILWKKWMPAR